MARSIWQPDPLAGLPKEILDHLPQPMAQTVQELGLQDFKPHKYVVARDHLAAPEDKSVTVATLQLQKTEDGIAVISSYQVGKQGEAKLSAPSKPNTLEFKNKEMVDRAKDPNVRAIRSAAHVKAFCSLSETHQPIEGFTVVLTKTKKGGSPKRAG